MVIILLNVIKNDVFEEEGDGGGDADTDGHGDECDVGRQVLFLLSEGEMHDLVEEVDITSTTHHASQDCICKEEPEILLFNEVCLEDEEIMTMRE